MLRTGESQWYRVRGCVSHSLLPSLLETTTPSAFIHSYYTATVSRVLNDFHVRLKKESLSRSVSSTAYRGIEDYEIFQKWPPCDFLIAKYISLGYFLQCRNSGQNPCLWQEEERWHQRSECLGRAARLILRWLCSWQALLLALWPSQCSCWE